MHNDPFARFERSRGGLLIPIAVFMVGSIATTLALVTIERVAAVEDAANQRDAPGLAAPDPALPDPAAADHEAPKAAPPLERLPVVDSRPAAESRTEADLSDAGGQKPK